MKHFKRIRQNRGFSQRQLADRAGVAFRTIQLLEKGRHNVRLLTLGKILEALGYSKNVVEKTLGSILDDSNESIRVASKRILTSNPKDWQVHLFNFVDAFRRNPDLSMISEPPDADTNIKLMALMASVVEMLCEEHKMKPPWWCESSLHLSSPWFVSETENLKAMALQESPSYFRKRNIFVLNNFLDRI